MSGVSLTVTIIEVYIEDQVKKAPRRGGGIGQYHDPFSCDLLKRTKVLPSPNLITSQMLMFLETCRINMAGLERGVPNPTSYRLVPMGEDYASKDSRNRTKSEN